MAGYNTDGIYTAGLCEQILTSLADHTLAGNLPSNKRSYLGFLDYLQSPLNKGGVTAIPYESDNAKYAQVRIKYQQRTVESEVTTSEDGNCEPERYPDWLETTLDVTRVVSYNFGLKKRQVARICDGGNMDELMGEINQTFDALARKVNSKLLDLALANMGYNYGNSPASASSKSVNFITAATGAPLALGIQALDQDYYEKNQYFGTPAIIGAGNVMKYWKTIASGCCNQDGVDMASYANSLGWAPFLDTMIESTFGSNQFMVLAPGMLQLVPYHRYVGDNAGQFGTAVDTLITDPHTGLTYDMKVNYDGCNESYYVRLTLNYELWYQPVDVYNAGDPLYRTNGMTRYTAATA